MCLRECGEDSRRGRKTLVVFGWSISRAEANKQCVFSGKTKPVGR